jgi:hypothetical protein
MAWGPLIALLLKALPDILFLWRHRVESGDREAIHEDVQEFREALQLGIGDCGLGIDGARAANSEQRLPVAHARDGVDLDRAAELLERRVREARRLRAGGPQAGQA